MSDVTRILSQIHDGDAAAAEQLLPLVYDELRKLAAAKLAGEKPGQTLQATALVHEAYLRLVDAEGGQHWDNCGHFFAAAAEAMRRILIERARQRKSLKRGGDHQRVELDAVVPAPTVRRSASLTQGQNGCYSIMSTEVGGFPNGDAVCTRQHAWLKNTRESRFHPPVASTILSTAS